MGARGLAIRSDISAGELRRLARREVRRSASARMYAIANAQEGLSRAEAARLAGMERQALRDAMVRYNAEGLAGLQDRPRLGPKPRLEAAERKALSELILKRPDVEASGLSAWTLRRAGAAQPGLQHRHDGVVGMHAGTGHDMPSQSVDERPHQARGLPHHVGQCRAG
jgi:transposase